MTTDTNVQNLVINTLTQAQYESLDNPSDTELYLIPDESEGTSRNIGEIIPSLLPLTDAGLHLLDGDLIQGDGIYKEFVDYIADLYNESPKVSNVTKVGTLADNNGVLSGFSTSNYATLPGSVSFGSNFEIVLKFKTGSNVTDSALLFRSGNHIACFAIETDSVFGYNIGNGSGWLARTNNKGSHTVQPNTTYYGKLTYNGAVYKAYISTDNENWEEDWSFTSSNIIPNTIINIGLNTDKMLGAWLGTIDLKESYININGQRWWSGVTHSWATEEAQWQASVTQYGVCGKFVYDSENNTVRLPKITGIIEGTTDLSAFGELVEQYVKLPDITGTFLNGHYTTGATGAFYDAGSGGTKEYASVADDKKVGFRASRSSSVYSGNGTDTKIQPQTIKVLYYIVIATSTKTDIQVDIDEVATDLNSKVDKADLAEVQCVVETYQNGTSWYRVWSDGWCEQGGRVSKTVGDEGLQTINLIKSYTDTNYSINSISSYAAGGMDNAVCTINSSTITSSSFQIVPHWVSAAGYLYWFACGYIEV